MSHFILRPITAGMVPVPSEKAPDLTAFEVRCRFNRWWSVTARAGINITQEMVDAKWAEIRAEVEAA